MFLFHNVYLACYYETLGNKGHASHDVGFRLPPLPQTRLVPQLTPTLHPKL